MLVLAPHPDDESLGCGGLIAEAVARQRQVHVAILTDGAMSHTGSVEWPARRLAMQRGAEAREATATLGVRAERLHMMGEPDSDAPHDGPRFAAASRRLRSLVSSIGASTVVTSWPVDPHGDHGSAHELTAATARELGLRHVAFPVWAWTLADDADIPDSDVPTMAGAIRGARLDISAHLPAKRRAIAAHRSQHGLIVDDDPAGFVLPPGFLALFDRPWEVYLRMS